MSSSRDLNPPSIPYLIQWCKSLFAIQPPPPADLDLTGQMGIITGGNRGLGFQCADILLGYKISHLIITVRNEKSGNDAVAELKKLHPKANVEAWSLDMESYDSIQKFVKRCADLARIDFVILNAGIQTSEFVVSERTGHELVFQVNYLSTVLLTFLLLPILKRTKNITGKPSRVTIAGSGLAFMAKFPEQGVNPIIPAFDEKPANWGQSVAVDRYSTTKLMLLMFIDKLRNHVAQDEVVVNVGDPGFVGATGFDRDIVGPVGFILSLSRRVVGRNIRAGAWTMVDAAVVKPATSHGSWTYNWQVYW